VIFGLLVTAVFLLNVMGGVHIGLLHRLEALTYDLRLHFSASRAVARDVVIVDIDEKSLAEEGHWPWPRDKLAQLLDTLFNRDHVALVGFDVVFAEKDNSSGLPVLEHLARGTLKGDARYRAALRTLRRRLDYDGLFAQALKGRRVILGYYFTFHGENRARVNGMLPPPVFPAGAFRGMGIPFAKATGYGANLPRLQKSALGAGHFVPLPDIDGVIRRVPMLVEYHGAYYESLALAMARAYLGDPPVIAGLPPGGGDYHRLEWLKIGDRKIPVDGRVMALIPYRGGQGSFRYFSAVDILRDRVDPAALAGAIVLVGTTAPGLMDLRSTPMGAAYPGVEIHANLIEGILHHRIKARPAYVFAVEFTTLLMTGLLLSLWLPFLSPLKSTLATAGVLAVVIGVNWAAWNQNLVLPLAAPLVMLLLLYALNMSYGFFVETRAKHKITGLFGQYVPPALVAEMSRDPEQFNMEGESRELTVLFSDVRGFTSISEGLPPKELTQLMNAYMTPMTQVIHKHRGTIDKYIGDAIMAFWGAPLRDDAHARHAVLAALEMQAALAGLRARFLQRGWPAVHIGVGVNSGAMSVGNMGSQFRVAYTVMGDAVNLGSRLEGLTKPYGVEIIVGEATRRLASGIVFRELDRVRVKGKAEAVAIYQPLGLQGEVDAAVEAEANAFAAVLALYRDRRWDEAAARLAVLREAAPESRLYALYWERIAHFRVNPPAEGWDGVFVFQTK